MTSNITTLRTDTSTPRSDSVPSSALHLTQNMLTRFPSGIGRWTSLIRGLILLACCCTWPLPQGVAQESADYFRQNCFSCHTIGGGRLTGPDLKGVLQRKDRDWLAKFMMDPKGVLASGDPYALKILEESRNVPMPTLPGMTRERADRLLDMIEAESKLEKSQFVGLQVSTKPFTDADRAHGQALFTGQARLAAGGVSCLSCHSLHGTAALGGGRLGPDLTNVYERLKGRAALSAWLMAPATETMQPVFKNHPLSAEEIHALVAYFESRARESPQDPSGARMSLLVLGLLGAMGLVFGFDTIWKQRFHSVRQPLVDATPERGHT